MKPNSPKAIKSKMIDIYNEELLNLNIYIKDEEELKKSRDLRELFFNSLREEFSYLGEDFFKDLSIYVIVPSFYERAYEKILEANDAMDYLNRNYGEETFRIERLLEEDKSSLIKTSEDSIFVENDRDELSSFDKFLEMKGNLFDEMVEEFDESAMIEIAYNHQDPEIRSFALSMVDKSYVLLDFLINDSDSYVRIAALYYLFGEEYFEKIRNLDCFRKIPMEIELKLDYDEAVKYFGIDEPLFEKMDRIIISEISYDAYHDDLTVRTDSKNSYEHAVSRISNQVSLKEIANYHNIWSTRYIAVKKLRDLDYLYDIALNGFDEDKKPRHGILYYPGEIGEGDVLKAVLERIIELRNLEGDDLDKFLKELFHDSKQNIIRRLCLSRITDDAFLFNIGTEEANRDFSRIILDQIKDESYLIILSVEILNNPIFDDSGYGNIRADACRKLIDMPGDTLSKPIGHFISKQDSKVSDKPYLSDILDKSLMDILIDVAKTDESSKVCSIAVSAIDDRDALMDIALGDGDREVSYNALKRIDDEEFTRDYLLKYKKDPLYLLRNDLIKDESILADIALNDSFEYTREEAVRNLKDEELLENIAKNDPEWNVRKEAISKIKNHDVLIDIAYNDSDNFVKRHAINRIDDEEILIDLLYKNDDYSILRDILDKIKNQEIIEDIAYNHSSWSTREDAVIKIKDNRVLSDIARNDGSWIVRKAAIMHLVSKFIKVIDKDRGHRDRYSEHLEKRKYLESLIDDDNGSESQDNEDNLNSTKNNENDNLSSNTENYEYIDADSIVLYEDEKEFTLQDLLVDIVYNDTSDDVREFAVSYISNEDILFDIAINDESTKVRLSAIDEIERNELLARIFVKSKNHHVYEAAISKIRYEYLLLKLTCIKSYYGELWPKRDLILERLNELGFKPPFKSLRDDDNKKAFMPVTREEYEKFLRDLKLLKKLKDDFDLDDYSIGDFVSDDFDLDDEDLSDDFDSNDYISDRIVF